MTVQTADEAGTAPAGTSVVPVRRRRRAPRTGQRLQLPSGLTLGVLLLWLSLLVIIPLASVVGHGFDRGWSGFWDAITNREVAAAIRLTVGLAIGVAVVNAVLGTVIAWVLVRERFRGSWLLELVIDIPFALPTVVAGLVMLAIYGSDSPIGVHLVGTRTGLFVTLLFVTLPFVVRTTQPVLLELDRDAEQAAASLGASGPAVFRRIVLPQILPAVASGAALAFARALGEYGSLVFISSNLPYKTEIASSFIYGTTQNSDNPSLATQQGSAVAIVLLLASVVVLVLINVIEWRVARRA